MFPGANLTDRIEHWETNSRCPDIVVILDESRVTDLESAIVGGPEFLVEVASPGDRWPETLTFYAKIGVRELLVIDRNRKQLELFRSGHEVLTSVGSSSRSTPLELKSDVLPLTFQWTQKSGKSRIVIRRNDNQPQSWLV